MKLTQWIKTGKRIFCCLLVLVLTAGQSAPLVYAQEIGKSSARTGEKNDAYVGRFHFWVYDDGYAEIAENQGGYPHDPVTVIPSEITYQSVTYPVVSIADNAFSDCTNITSLEIPDSVTSIGNNAFKNSEIQEIKLSANLLTIGDGAFEKCDFQTIEIPESVISIGEGAFRECRNLKYIKIPEKIQTIKYGTFAQSGLERIEIPDSVTNIENSAFGECKSLLEIKLPENLQIIGNNVFIDCKSLKKIEIPDSVTKIGQLAFGGSGLQEVKLSNKLQTIETGTFSGCGDLRTVEMPDSITTIERSAFRQCLHLEEIKLSDNLQTIGEEAFAFGFLKNVEIPNSVHTSAAGFKWAELLETAKIPDSMLINNTFLYCMSLETLQIKVRMQDGKVIPVENVSGIDGFEYNTIGATTPVQLNRKLEFWTEDGQQRLAGEALETAQKAYLAVEDGDTNDNLWYGWEVVPPAYEVTITVNKDGKTWMNHDRILKLTKDNGNSFVGNLSSVEDGMYEIVDFTENADGINTGVAVEVNGSNVTSAALEYFTVTFYDGVDNPYGINTAQKPQIVLSGTNATVPVEPQKPGYRFNGWKIDENGQTPFDFSVKITNTTGIYAGWTKNPVKRQYTITASAGEGGVISPSGSVVVEEGKNQEFLIVPEEGYEILSVEADSIKQEAAGSYVFTNVTANHSIHAEFIKKNTGEIQPPTEPENPTKPEMPTESEQPTSPEPPTEAEQPTQPEKPTTPDAPDEPDVPDTPTDFSDTSSSSTGGSTKDSEPVTSGLSHINMYATIAMIAGISYLLLYFVEKKQGMSEEKKNKLVASLIAWAKSGAGSQRALKRAAAFIFIVFILVYYHAIGKKLFLEWENLYEN